MIETRFKDTEIGLIPEDWEVKKLGDIGDVSMCKRVMKYQTTEKGDIPFYKIGTFGNKADAYITRELFDDLKQKYSYPQKGAILLSAAGTIGRTVVFDGNDSYFQDSNIVWIDNDESSVLNSYLYYCYKTMKWETENGGIVTRLYNDNLKSALLLVPNIQEQAVIASALSDVDVLLRELGELIAKKKAIKMGMMQELLTVEAVPGKEGAFRPKRRLEGFEGDWVEKRLGELGDLTGSGVDKKCIENETPVRLVNYLDVFHKTFLYNNELNFWVTANNNKLEQCDVKKGDVFFTPSSEMPYDIALSALAMEDMPFVCYSYHVYRLRFKEDVDLLYRTYMFKTDDFYRQASFNCEGSGKRYVISLKRFRDFVVFLPPTNAEQTAIAEVLSDMDAEIAALEAKRAKYEQVKNGMMQELLTGRIRLR